MGGAPDLRELTDTALRVARAGGAAIVRTRGDDRSGARADSKGIRRDLITASDRASEEAVVSGILEAYPDHAVIAEEGALTPQGRVSSDSEFVWIVDPLDGTTNFVHGLPYFCVSVALVRAGVPSVGVAHAPDLGVTYHAHRGGGAFRNDAPIRVSETTALADALLATGFSYVRDEPGNDDNVARLGRALHACRDLRRHGSAELDLCMTADGHFDAYWELYLSPWDVAAGSVVVREAGGRVTDLTGGDDWLFGQNILASNGALHDAVLGVVGGALPS